MAYENLQQKNPDAIIVSFPELISEIGGSCAFGLDELVAQIAAKKDGEDYHLYHRRSHYIVPFDKIQEYFVDHTRPIPPMNEKEELEYLRKKVKELELQKVGEKKPEHKRDLEEKEPESPKASEKEEITYPQRDESIPPPKRETPEEVAQRLAQELKGKRGPKRKTMTSAKPKNIMKAPVEEEAQAEEAI